jgi:predicted O-methyltransferase YrrM
MNPPRSPAAIRAAAAATGGFLSEDEGDRLAELAHRAAASGAGPVVEIGGYLGRSTLYLAAGIASSGTTCRLYSIDHHHGSEEMQAGWPDHDPRLIDRLTGRMDTLGRWRAAIDAAAVESFVVGVVGDSAAVAGDWSTLLSLVFIDGGHGAAICWADYRGWGPLVAPGGALVFHDVYPDPADGGRPPYECYRDAIGSGAFVEDVSSATGSLRVLRRVEAKTAAVGLPPTSRSAASSTAAAE